MATNWDYIEKSGFPNGGWDYNENNLNYNQDEDVDTGSSVLYNHLGTIASWTYINKN